MTAAAPSAPALRRWWRQPFGLTREGWTCLVIVAVLLAIGIAKNINLVVLLGYVLLAAIVLSGLVAGHRLGQLQARRQLEEQHFAGTSARLEVRLRNPSGHACVGVRVEDAGPASTASAGASAPAR
jgi:uncharacterized protein (DUF58 family)